MVTVDHLHLRSRDAVAAAAFYRTMFDATPLHHRVVDGLPKLGLSLGGLTLLIDEVPPETPSAPSPLFVGIEHLCLAVTDLDAVAADLRAKGAAFEIEPRVLRPGVRYAFVKAPDGIRLELIERS